MLRRFAAVAALAVLAPVGLAACQSDPAVAAYVGDVEITEERVNGVVSEMREFFEGEIEAELAAQQSLEEGDLALLRERLNEQLSQQLADGRERVVVMLILTEAGTRYAADHDLEVPEPDLERTALAAGMPEDHPYVAVAAGFQAMTRALEQQATAGEPSEADQREVYENLRVAGRRPAETFEEVQPALTPELLGGPVGVRDLLTVVVEQADIRVQPGYDLAYQVPVVLGGGAATSWLGVQISEPSSVRDAD